MQRLIDPDFNYQIHQAEGKGTASLSLIDQLLRSDPYTRNSAGARSALTAATEKLTETTMQATQDAVPADPATEPESAGGV